MLLKVASFTKDSKTEVTRAFAQEGISRQRTNDDIFEARCESVYQ